MYMYIYIYFEMYFSTFKVHDLVNMAEFVLNNNIFEFNCKAYQQKLGTAIQIKIEPPYVCIYMDEI